MALVWLLVLVLPLLEIAVFIQVGNAIGLAATLALVVLAALAGVTILRLQSFATLRRVQAALGRNELPARELFDGACLLVAGILLLIPGFVTVMIAVVLLVPAVRRLLRRSIWARVTIRHRAAGGSGRERPRGPIIDADFTEVEPRAREPSASPWAPPPVDGSAR